MTETRTLSGHRRAPRPQPIGRQGNVARDRLMSYQNRPDEAATVAKALGGRRNGSGWLCRCPAHDDRSPSLSVGTGRDGRLLVYCHAGCEPTDVLADLRRLSILEGKRTDGPSPRRRPPDPKPDPFEEADRQRRIDRAIDIYHGSGSIRGTLGERYLIEHRGITVTTDPDADPYLFERLRFHPQCPFKSGRAPAIVAAVTGPSGYLRGIWRIRLDGFGRKVERLGLGECRGGAVRLVPALDDEHIAIGEGVEDALAWSQLTGQPAWAGCSTSGMAGVVLPDRFRRVTIVADADDAGIKAAKKLASRLKAEGRTVQAKRPPMGFKDANACLEARP